MGPKCHHDLPEGVTIEEENSHVEAMGITRFINGVDLCVGQFVAEIVLDTSTFTTRGSSALYGKTKLLNIMFTGEPALQLSGTGVTVNALNPGFNVTGLGRELWFASALEHILKFLHIGDPRKGADIIIRLVVE